MCNPVAICTERVEAKKLVPISERKFYVAICTERVEAKWPKNAIGGPAVQLQSARSVWRQSSRCRAFL